MKTPAAARSLLALARPAAAAALLLLLIAPVASAHADLVSATPPPNTRVDVAPTELVLTFSEQLEDRYTRVEVIDGRGVHYERGNVIDPETRTRITVPVNAMPQGVYTIRWRTLSVDTHTYSNSYLLAINTSFITGHMDHMDHMAEHSDHEAGSAASNIEAGARAVGFMGAALAAGIPLFLLVVARGNLPEARESVLKALGFLSALAAVVAGLVLLVFIAARAELTLGDALATTTGSRLAWRLGLLGAASLLLIVSLFPLENRRATQGALALAGASGIGALLATSLSSHAAAQIDGQLLAIGMDWLHLVAVALWVGGVVGIALAATGGVRAPDLGAIIGRFHPFAMASVVVVIVTGFYGAAIHLKAPTDLAESAYGNALGLKMLLMLPLLGLGAYNARIVRPRLLAAGETGATRGLKRSVLVEVAIMTVILVAAGVLANNAPPSDAAAGAGGSPGADAFPPAGAQHTFEREGYRFATLINPQPVKVGFQNLTVSFDPQGKALPENAAVFVALYPPSDPASEGHIVQLAQGPNNRWSSEGPLFNEPGEWQVKVTLQGKGTYITETFALPVAAS